MRGNGDEESSEDEEDGFGPVLPTRREGGASGDESGYKRDGHGQRSGPAIPSIEDLQLRKGEKFLLFAQQLANAFPQNPSSKTAPTRLRTSATTAKSIVNASATH